MSRILITGSRDWTSYVTISVAIHKARLDLGDSVGNTTIVSGNCPTGADNMAEEYARLAGLPLELYPADWKTHGRRAGFVRNAEMVNLGADICLVFIKNESKGATMTADLAEKNGIPVKRFIA